MKKSKIIVITILALLLLFIPIPTGVYKDGGTRAYTALTYKVVKWNRLIDKNTRYSDTSVYWLPDNFKSIDELWVIEQIERGLSY